MGTLLEKAIIFAVKAHADQLDKAGIPYILHPLAVMLDPSLTTEEDRVVAVLHDVLEDTHATEEELLREFGSLITSAVSVLTKGKDERGEEGYKRYIERVKATGCIPLSVKKADIRHNISYERLKKLSTLDEQLYLYDKYFAAKQILGMDE